MPAAAKSKSSQIPKPDRASKSLLAKTVSEHSQVSKRLTAQTQATKQAKPLIEGRGYSYYINLQNTGLNLQLGSNGRGSWRGRHGLISKARETARLKLLEALDGKQLEKPVQVICRRYYSGNYRAMDEHDNLRTCFKPYVDGIAAALWPDLNTGRGDDSDHMLIEYQQTRAEKGVNYLEFEIRPIPEGSYCYIADEDKAWLIEALSPSVLNDVKLSTTPERIARFRNYITAMLSVKGYATK